MSPLASKENASIGGAIGALCPLGIDEGIHDAMAPALFAEVGVLGGNQLEDEAEVDLRGVQGGSTVRRGPPPREISPNFSAKLVHSSGHAFLVGIIAW